MNIDYKITHYKEGKKPNTVTIGVQVFNNPKYETSAFIFEEVELVPFNTDGNGSGDISLVGISANLIFSDLNAKGFSTELEEDTESFMKQLLQQIGIDSLSARNKLEPEQ